MRVTDEIKQGLWWTITYQINISKFKSGHDTIKYFHFCRYTNTLKSRNNVFLEVILQDSFMAIQIHWRSSKWIITLFVLETPMNGYVRRPSMSCVSCTFHDYRSPKCKRLAHWHINRICSNIKHTQVWMGWRTIIIDGHLQMLINLYLNYFYRCFYWNFALTQINKLPSTWWWK